MNEVKQLTREDILKVRKYGIVLYNNQALYVEMPDEYPYYRFNKGIPKPELIELLDEEPYYMFGRGSVGRWERSDKLDEYYESSLMGSYLTYLSKEEAFELLNSWGYEI